MALVLSVIAVVLVGMARDSWRAREVVGAVQQPHIDANLPADGDFKPFLERDLAAWVTIVEGENA